MARYKEEIDTRYEELCDMHCDAVMTGNTKMTKVSPLSFQKTNIYKHKKN